MEAVDWRRIFVLLSSGYGWPWRSSFEKTSWSLAASRRNVAVDVTRSVFSCAEVDQRKLTELDIEVGDDFGECLSGKATLQSAEFIAKGFVARFDALHHSPVFDPLVCPHRGCCRVLVH
jgi:hypothetical protein